MSLHHLEIDNSIDSAIKSGKWSNPGASFYDKLLNSFYCKDNVPEDAKELEKKIKSGKYLQWNDFLKEAYLIAPIKDIKNSPYGVTPFSRSGCKYPHHEIRNNKLVLSVPGVKAAYARAKQQGVYSGEIKSHLERHIKDLGELVNFQETIENNFDDIYEFIMERTGINLFNSEVFEEKKTREQYAREKFKKKYKYDPKDSTIEVDGKRIKVDIGNSRLIQLDGEYTPRATMSTIVGDDMLITGNDFFKTKNQKRRDAILQHEIGHLKMHRQEDFDKSKLFNMKFMNDDKQRSDVISKQLSAAKDANDLLSIIDQMIDKTDSKNISLHRKDAEIAADKYLKGKDPKNTHLTFDEIEENLNKTNDLDEKINYLLKIRNFKSHNRFYI